MIKTDTVTVSVLEDGGMYVPVNQRVMQFHKDHPDWGIETEILECNSGVYKEGKVSGGYASVRAVVRNEKGRIMGSGTKASYSDALESPYDKDFLAAAETLAVGRALAMVGYGTADMLAGTPGLADAPVKPKEPAKLKDAAKPESAEASDVFSGVVSATKNPTTAEREQNGQNVPVTMVEVDLGGGNLCIAYAWGASASRLSKIKKGGQIKVGHGNVQDRYLHLTEFEVA